MINISFGRTWLVHNYANKTSTWLNEQKVPFVPKVANPPNVPKARPIEDFLVNID